MTRFTIALVTGCLSTGLAIADAPKIDRTIAKEPAYQTEAPKYGMLVFGPEGKDRVWLVLDGDTLYVDRNGNGDLTDAGEMIAAEKKAERDPEKDGYTFEVGDVPLGGRVHKGLTVYFEPLKIFGNGALGKRPDVKAAIAKDPKSLVVSVYVDIDMPGMKGCGIGGRVRFSAGSTDLTGVFQFSDTPMAAPAVRFGGPLQVTFYGELPTLRVGRDTELVLVVGTPGVGRGTFAMLYYEETIPENAKPAAEINFPPGKSGETAEKLRLELKSRC